MEKIIVSLTGSPNCKNKFNVIAKTKYWIWNINHLNVVGVACRQIGWDGIRNEKYYNFVDKISLLANEFWNFKTKYIVEMIEKFIKDDTATLLIIHGGGKTINPILQKYNGLTIHLADEDEKIYEEYDYTINLDDNFDKNILNLLNKIAETRNKL